MSEIAPCCKIAWHKSSILATGLLTMMSGMSRPTDMLSELYEDNKALVLRMRAAHDLCGDAADVATTSLRENWIDETQCRIWFLFEDTRA
jgi:DNA-binding ferritin-like protein